MDIYVIDPNLQYAGIVDDYKSIIWTTRYFTSGDFELYVPATQKNIELLQKDRYLCRDRDIRKEAENIIHENVMIIEKIQITTSIEDGNYLTVTGRSLKSIIGRRITWSQTTMNGNVESCLRRVVDENCINPKDNNRKIPRLQLGEPINYAGTMEKQSTGDNLETLLTEICTSYGLGWDIYIKNESFIFQIFEGSDRSYKQTINPYVVFSPEFDNLLSTDYYTDKTGYKNVALVGGEGEGTDREYTIAGAASGMERYETFVDVGSVSSNEEEITEELYWKLLAEAGEENLAENGVQESIEGEAEAYGNYRLNEDYFLGDIVEIVNEYGIEATPRITEIIDSEDDTGRKLIPTFSTWEV